MWTCSNIVGSAQVHYRSTWSALEWSYRCRSVYLRGRMLFAFTRVVSTWRDSGNLCASVQPAIVASLLTAGGEKVQTLNLNHIRCYIFVLHCSLVPLGTTTIAEVHFLGCKCFNSHLCRQQFVPTDEQMLGSAGCLVQLLHFCVWLPGRNQQRTTWATQAMPSVKPTGNAIRHDRNNCGIAKRLLGNWIFTEQLQFPSCAFKPLFIAWSEQLRKLTLKTMRHTTPKPCDLTQILPVCFSGVFRNIPWGLYSAVAKLLQLFWLETPDVG